MRVLRADAQRNRALLLDAAAKAFAEQGLDVAVAEVARRAGVSIGTLFRHFPTKHDLLISVLEASFVDIRDALTHAEQEPDAGAAFDGLLFAIAEHNARDRAFLHAAFPEMFGDPRLQRIRQEMVAGMAALIDRAQREGAVRADLRPQDIPFILKAIGGTIADTDGLAPGLWRRYLRILLDGLRPEGATALDTPALTEAQLQAVLELRRSRAGHKTPTAPDA